MLKNKKFALTALAVLVGLTSHTVAATSASASTPAGYHWLSGYKTYQNNASGSYNQGIWTTAASNWTSAVIGVSLSSGANSSFKVGETWNNGVNWDGICYTTFEPNYLYLTTADCYINTYYTSATKYSNSTHTGITTHELGHAMGLNHSTSNSDKSVMVSGTFWSDGTLCRVYNTPQSQDISTMNSMYPIALAPTTEPLVEKEAKKSHKKVVALDVSWSVAYKSLQDLAAASDLVVIGEVESNIGTKAKNASDYSNYQTQSSIRIDKVLSGDATLSGTSLTLSQMGGEDHDVKVVHDTTTPVKKGEKVLLFLTKTPEGDTIPINADTGLYIQDSQSGKFTNALTHESLSLLEIQSKMK